MKRAVSLLLIIAMLCAVSCGSTGTETADTSTGDTSASTVETSAPEETSGVPDSLDLNGMEINIWTPAESSVISETYISMNAEQTGEILDDAIFAVNRAVEEKLNCKLNLYADIPVGETPNSVRNMILADDTTYDAFHVIQWSGAALCTEDLYLNLIDAPYISFDKPWWDYAYMKEMTVGHDKLFCLVGDYAVDRTRNMNCVFFNKKLYESYYGNADELYESVLDGEWTVDRMREISADVWTDVNNDGKADRGDVLGYCLNTLSNLDGFFYGGDVHVTTRDDKDVPVLSMMNEHNVDVCTKLYELVYETEGVFVSGSSFDEEMMNRKKFSEDTSMFLVGFFYTAESLRDMNADYGIVPLPKYNEEQEDYVSNLHNVMRDMVLPINCRKVDAVCAVLEELAFLGNKEVIPSYYEVVLKEKYARDELSAQMLDLIKSRCRTDIAYIYGTYFNSMGLLFRNMISQKQNSIASLYEQNRSAAESKMQTLIDMFLE